MGRLESSISSSTLEDWRWRLLCSSWRDGNGRRPATSSSSATLPVERRPKYFLPTDAPYGRQLQVLLGGLGLLAQPWRSRRTKWCVPGGGVVQVERTLFWTRSRFPQSVRGPFCKSQGLGCVFSVSVGPLCKMYCPFVLLI